MNISTKEEVKQALFQILKEDNEDLKLIIQDIIEDIIFGRIIENSDKEDYVDENLVFDALKE